MFNDTPSYTHTYRRDVILKRMFLIVYHGGAPYVHSAYIHKIFVPNTYFYRFFTSWLLLLLVELLIIILYVKLSTPSRRQDVSFFLLKHPFALYCYFLSFDFVYVCVYMCFVFLFYYCVLCYALVYAHDKSVI